MQFLPTPPAFHAPVRVIPSSYCRDHFHHKTRDLGIVCMILCLAILVQLRHVTDRQTDKETDSTYNEGKYRASSRNDLEGDSRSSELFYSIRNISLPIDWVKVLRPIWHKIGHLGDVLPSQSLGLVLVTPLARRRKMSMGCRAVCTAFLQADFEGHSLTKVPQGQQKSREKYTATEQEIWKWRSVQCINKNSSQIWSLGWKNVFKHRYRNISCTLRRQR